MIIDELISSLAEDCPVRKVHIGTFWTAVVSRTCGLSSTVVNKDHEPGQTQVTEAGGLTEKSALELSKLARSNSVLEASVGLAAINSLLTVDETRCVDLNAGDYLEEKGRGKKVAVVGHFPFIPRLKQSAAQLWVLERRPTGEDLAADMASVVLPQADIVAITGTALINHTMDELLGLCRPDSLVMVLGPTSPLSPILFEHGVDVISGARVVDTDLVLRCAAEGAIFRQFRGTRLVTISR